MKLKQLIKLFGRTDGFIIGEYNFPQPNDFPDKRDSSDAIWLRRLIEFVVFPLRTLKNSFACTQYIPPVHIFVLPCWVFKLRMFQTY